MREWEENIKRRREKQIRKIQQGLYSPTLQEGKEKKQDPFFSGWELATNKEPKKKNRIDKWLTQALIALFLLIGVYVVFQFPTERGIQVQGWIAQVMTEEIQFEQLRMWYQKLVGGNPSILPVFQPKSKQESFLWQLPVSGKIILPFDEKRKGMVWQTDPGTEVAAAAEGWIQFAGKKPDLGNVVIIQHAKGYESWYGLLEKVHLKENDWVKKGQPIGEVGEKDGQHLLFFAIKKEGKFISPSGVIPLE